MEGIYSQEPVGCGNQVGPVIVPVMIFDGREGCSCSFPHNNLMVIELKVASTLVHKILTNARSSADIMTWNYLKRLKRHGKDITPLVHPIMGYR